MSLYLLNRVEIKAGFFRRLPSQMIQRLGLRPAARRTPSASRSTIIANQKENKNKLEVGPSTKATEVVSAQTTAE